MPEEQRIAAIVLAAGRSSRMGTHKLLLPLGDRLLVSYAVSAALESRATPVVVVLGHDAERVRAALPCGPSGPYHTVLNTRYAEGMATSLQAGLAAVSGLVAGAIILLADQPLLTSTSINHILAVATTHPESIVAATYAGSRGHPVYFPSHLFDELRAVVGDQGGRSVISHHADRLISISIEPPELGLDVDEPLAYERLLAAWSRYSGNVAP